MIRFAEAGDIDAIQCFLRKYWRSDHIFVRSREILEWQHVGSGGTNLNFVLGLHGDTGEVMGLLGFIPLSRFDGGLGDSLDFWLAIWRVRDDVQEVAGLGLVLLQFLRSRKNPRSIGAVGLSKMVVPIYKALGYKVGKLRQFFVLNPEMREFAIAEPGKAVDASSFSASATKFYRYAEPGRAGFSAIAGDLDALLEAQASIPRKSAAYFRARYLEHPIYRYRLILAYRQDRLIGLTILRKVEVGRAKALRMVDLCSGASDLSFLASLLPRLMKEEDAEFVDFYCHGFDSDAVRSAGLLDVDDFPGTVIPNYFEPFEKRRVDLDFAYWTRLGESRSYRFVKGDSDQDRPNVVSGVPL
jgi:hypothetical protein